MSDGRHKVLHDQMRPQHHAAAAGLKVQCAHISSHLRQLPACLCQSLIRLQVEGAFSMEKLSPRLSKNAPPHSGRIMWARCLQERIAGDILLLKDWICHSLGPVAAQHHMFVPACATADLPPTEWPG